MTGSHAWFRRDIHDSGRTADSGRQRTQKWYKVPRRIPSVLTSPAVLCIYRSTSCRRSLDKVAKIAGGLASDSDTGKYVATWSLRVPLLPHSHSYRLESSKYTGLCLNRDCDNVHTDLPSQKPYTRSWFELSKHVKIVEPTPLRKRCTYRKTASPPEDFLPHLGSLRERRSRR